MGYSGDRGSVGPSGAGLISCLVGLIMLAVQLGVILAMAAGVRDSQG